MENIKLDDYPELKKIYEEYANTCAIIGDRELKVSHMLENIENCRKDIQEAKTKALEIDQQAIQMKNKIMAGKAEVKVIPPTDKEAAPLKGITLD